MELTDLAGTDDIEQAQRSTFLGKLSAEVESLVINLDHEKCQALLEKMASQTSQGECLVEMKALRTLRIEGSPRQWQLLEQTSMRLLQVLRPIALEELSLIGIDQTKVIRALLSFPSFHETLRSLRLGLHGFHFLAQEDLLAIVAPFVHLRSLHLYGMNANSILLICATAFLEYLGQIPNPDEVEVLHVAKAGFLGGDAEIASLLRCLASFTQLRCLKLPLPVSALPLSLRELISLRLAMPRLIFFCIDPERIEGADVWPEDDWPPMVQFWTMCETITPLSVFSNEFVDFFADVGQTAGEWSRLSDTEQEYWNGAVPLIQKAYRHWEHTARGAIPSSLEQPGDASDMASGSAAAQVCRAVPEVRELEKGEYTGTQGEHDRILDISRASTNTIEDWRTEERSALRGVLGMKASDVCKEKARLRREGRGNCPREGAELFAQSGSQQCVRAMQDAGSVCEAPEELLHESGQQCCAREQVGAELGAQSSAIQL